MVLDEIQEYLDENRYKIKGSVIDFVSEVSNIYHEIESENYNDLHKVMFDIASRYWNDLIIRNLDVFKEDLVILDYGCGTGFAINEILKSPLKSKIKKIICYDLSSHMIKKCRKNIFKNNYQIQNIEFEFYSGSEGFNNVNNQKYDLILTNALLHHLVDLKTFFKFIQSNLKKDGVFIVGHEPNTNFYHNKELIKKTQLFQKYKRIVTKLNLNYFLIKLKFKKNKNLNIFSEANDKLLSKRIINKPLPNQIIPKLVDIHVPIGLSLNQIWGEIGFNSDLILKKYLKDFKLLDIKTYFHIKDYKAYKSYYWRSIINSLEKKFPNDGADCIMIFKKYN